MLRRDHGEDPANRCPISRGSLLERARRGGESAVVILVNRRSRWGPELKVRV